MNKADWITKLLLLGIVILLGLNILQAPVTHANAEDNVIISPGNNLLNLGSGLVLVQQDYELYLVGVRKTYEHPIDDHTLQILSSKVLER